MKLHLFWLILVWSYSTACNAGQEAQENQALTDTASRELNRTALDTKRIPELDLLALDPHITSLLDEHVAIYDGQANKLERLHSFLFDPGNLHIQYDAYSNKTAKETFYSTQGNCISLANLFVAAARHVGLDAHYQVVEIAREWRPQGEFFEVPGHINVVVNLPFKDAIIEFDGTYYDQTRQRKFTQKVISDERAKAEFYNNLGVEKLSNKSLELAVNYFKKSINIDKTVDFTWSNLGVAYKHLGKFKKAEKSYLKALKLNPKNNSVIRNLFILYKSVGDKQLVRRYQKKAEKYARKNPYHLHKLANKDIDKGDYQSATKLVKKAIRIHDLEPDFFHTLATAYFYTNKRSQARQALAHAKTLAESDEYKKRFQKKINTLANRQ